MKEIKTTRFGEIAISSEHIITFKDGMIGFPTLKQYVLIESNSMPMLLWLQSVDAPEVAFPVMEPWFFKRDYKVTLSEADRICIESNEKDILKTFVVLTVPPDMLRMTVNLKAPVMINIEKALATQIILQDKTLEVRVAAHEAFSKAVANFQVHQSASNFDEADESFNAVNVKQHQPRESAA